jgi:hypothetical protein
MKNIQKADPVNEDKKFPLPVYDEKDDIYQRAKETSLQNEDILEEAQPTGPGDDLDIPGAESDNSNEVIGEEDEENNYYSLGGDEHDDLEEDNG